MKAEKEQTIYKTEKVQKSWERYAFERIFLGDQVREDFEDRVINNYYSFLGNLCLEIP